MAPAQPTFSDLEASLGRVEPHYPKAGGGRPPVPLGTMLRLAHAQYLARGYGPARAHG